MNTFSLKAVNLDTSLWGLRLHTTCSQLYYSSLAKVLYLPSFDIVLSSNGEDWEQVLNDLADLKSKSFYSDAPERPVKFGVTFDFGYSNLTEQKNSSFFAKAKLCLEDVPLDV